MPQQNRIDIIDSVVLNHSSGKRGCGCSAQGHKMDVLKFIDSVRQRDCIYNKSCADYRQRDVVFDSWRGIAHDMNAKVTECKEKWHNLRSNYMRERKKVLGPGVKKWHLLDALSFLEPHHSARSGLKRRSHRKSVANIHSDNLPLDLDEFESLTPQNVTSTEHFTFDEIPNPHSVQGDSPAQQDHDIDLMRLNPNSEACTSRHDDQPEKECNKADVACYTEITSPKEIDTKHKSKRNQRTRRRLPSDSIDYEFLKQVRKLSRHLNESIEDPDRMFLLSLLPLVKQLSPRDNLNFRVHVQQILEQKLTK